MAVNFCFFVVSLLTDELLPDRDTLPGTILEPGRDQSICTSTYFPTSRLASAYTSKPSLFLL
jgi:hypothetical protein